jgi:hypothetical protein
MDNFKVEINYDTTEQVTLDDTKGNVRIQEIERICLIPVFDKDPDEEFYLLSIEEAKNLAFLLNKAIIKAEKHNSTKKELGR